MKTDFQALETTQKGNVGERIVRGILERFGWLIYDSKADKPHVVDFICHKASKGLIAVDVKTYPRRASYQDTGIDFADFTGYQAFEAEHGLPVYLAFVDEVEQAVYGNWLSHLVKRAERSGDKVYFPLSAMHLHRYLFPDELAALQAVSTVDKDRYSGVEYYFPWMRTHSRRVIPPPKNAF